MTFPNSTLIASDEFDMAHIAIIHKRRQYKSRHLSNLTSHLLANNSCSPKTPSSPELNGGDLSSSHQNSIATNTIPSRTIVIQQPKHSNTFKNHKLILFITLLTLLSPVVVRSRDQPNENFHKVSKRTPLSSTTSHTSSKLYQDDELLTNEVKRLLQYGYHNTTESLSEAINRLIQVYPNNVESFIIGKSVKNNPIIGLRITSTKTRSQADNLKPTFTLVGGIHGDHALGHELVLYLSAFLLEHFNSPSKDSRIKNLLNAIDLFVVPTLNPDGLQVAREGDCYSASLNSGRKNAAGIDLDEDFKFHNYRDISAVLANNNLQPETKSFLGWIVTEGTRVHMLATLRTGLTGIAYPFDEIFEQKTEHTYLDSGHSVSSNACPDKPLFEYLGNEIYYNYQENPMNSKCSLAASGETVMDGAQIGAAHGTLGDFLYRFTNIFPLNLYLDCCKYPKRDTLQSHWLKHANSLIALLGSANLGVTGTVKDSVSGKPVARATIAITGMGKNITTREEGQFWRPLPPSQKFDLHIQASDYKSQVKHEVLGSSFDRSTGLATPTTISINLHPINEKPAQGSKEAVETGGLDSSDKQINQKKSSLPAVWPTTAIMKPEVLFKNVDQQINKLDFKTPTNLRKHHKYDEMVEFLKNLNKRFPKLSRLYSIGKSKEGRDLWVLEISDKPGMHQIFKPEFRYISNMHGNEVVGRELTLHLAKLILENYSSSKLISALVNSTRIHIFPSMNPDGYELSREGDCESEQGRPNANKYDLNRNFPDRFVSNDENREVQPEVEAVMKWSKEVPFVLGANLHGGSLVANYPFDGNKDEKSGQYEAAPDDKLFVHLAKTYSQAHTTMSKGEHCYDICGADRTSLLNERFPDGITNGAQWYVLYGGIQDWVYLNTNCLSITVELGCTKFPKAETLDRYWSYNKKPLIKYILEIHRGIYGIVKDQNDRPLANATVQVKGINHDVHSIETGDYWRLLLPGEYYVSVSKEGYRTAHRTVTVGEHNSPALRVDFSLMSGPKDLSSNLNGIINDAAFPYSIPSASEEQDNNNHGSHFGSVSIASVTDKKNDVASELESKFSDSFLKNSTITIDGSKLMPEYQDTKYMLALCFIIVLPSIMLLVYMFGLTDSKRYPYRFGFSRLATSTGDDLDDADDDDNEGTRFVRRNRGGGGGGLKFSSLDNTHNSDSEDELYSVDSWNK